MCLLPSEHSSSGGYVINRRVREELQELGAQWIIGWSFQSSHGRIPDPTNGQAVWSLNGLCGGNMKDVFSGSVA